MAMLVVKLLPATLALLAPNPRANGRPPLAAIAAPVSVAVVVRATPQVSGGTFRLGEIADIAGGDPALGRQLADVEVGTSPLPGLTRPLFPSDITVRLRQRGIDPKRVDLQCPPSIRVLRASGEVPVDALSDAARSALAESRGDAGADDLVEPMPLTSRVLVSPGKVTYRAGAPKGRAESGVMSVPVSILVDGVATRTVDVSFRITRALTAVVAARTLEANNEIRPEDVALAKVAAPSGGTVVTDPQVVVGKRTTRRIAQGAAITEAAVSFVKVVAVGARVSLTKTIGGITITAPGTARSAGGVGERIRVYVEDTKSEVAAVVLDAATVRAEDR
jgi:flagella basal body P-ring formation protein FlgA